MDDQDFPITMGKPEAHVYKPTCACGPCKAIMARQMKCKHGFLVDGRCAHCGVSRADADKLDEIKASPWGSWAAGLGG